MVGFITIKSGRDAVFFAQGGLERLPFAYLLIAVSAIAAAMLHLKVMRSVGARPTRGLVLVSTALCLLGFVPLLEDAGAWLLIIFFSFVAVAFAAVFASVWLLAGDVLEGTPADRLGAIYASIGAGSMVGGAVGGLLARLLSGVMPPRYLIAVGALILLGVAGLVVSAHRRHPASGTSETPEAPQRVEAPNPPTDGRPSRSVILEPYVWALLGISSLGALAGLFIDFQFYAVAIFTGSNNVAFFADFYMLLNLASLAMQLFVTPHLQSRFGIGGAMLVLPLTLLGGIGWVAYSSTLLSRSALRVAEGGVKASVHRSVWEQTFLPLDPRRREQAKVLVDGAGARTAEGLGAGVLYLWLVTHQGADALSWISWMVAGSVTVWIGLVLYLVRSGCSGLKEVEGQIRLPDG